MIGEVNIYGVFVPWLLVLALLSLLASRLIGKLLAHLGFYRLVWHPPLFDLALFVIVLGIFSFISSHWF